MRTSAEYVQMANGLIVPRDYIPTRRPLCVDLFCGVGGFSLGMIEAGFHVLAGLDNDAGAALTYLTNLGEYGNLHIHCATPEDQERLEREIEREWGRAEHGVARATVVAGSGWLRAYPGTPGVQHFFFGDVRRWSGAEMLRLMGLKRGNLDCVVGGPPCQGFSTAGKRDVMDPRNSLVFEFVRLVIEMWPRTLVMENVPGILSMVTPEDIPVLDAVCLQLERAGYGTFDALKRALAGRAGARTAVRARPQGRAPEAEQPSLLSVEDCARAVRWPPNVHGCASRTMVKRRRNMTDKLVWPFADGHARPNARGESAVIGTACAVEPSTRGATTRGCGWWSSGS